MAAYITVGPIDRQWHIGEIWPFSDLETIEEIQACGDELAYFYERFENIPCSKRQVVIWNNPWANFIHFNMARVK